MATGDADDIVARIKHLIPHRWFAWAAPLRDALLGGLGDGAAWCYSWILYARKQSRIATSDSLWLDLIAYDFLGRYLTRSGMTDDQFRARIMATILQERVTRAGMFNAIAGLVGTEPKIFEPWNTGDAGAYGMGVIGYGQAGGWGSLIYPAQVLIDVTRPPVAGVPNLNGYGGWLGGYGTAAIQYINTATQEIGITNAMIYDIIAKTKPTGVIAWTRID